MVNIEQYLIPERILRTKCAQNIAIPASYEGQPKYFFQGEPEDKECATSPQYNPLWLRLSKQNKKIRKRRYWRSSVHISNLIKMNTADLKLNFVSKQATKPH